MNNELNNNRENEFLNMNNNSSFEKDSNNQIKIGSNINISSEEIAPINKNIRKINIQKIFNIVSFVFIFTCFMYYGFRFLKYYHGSNKVIEQKFIADDIRENNSNNNNFKKINGDYYFYGNSENNYLKYSNLIWRIIKVNSDGSITLVLNNPITVLSPGNNRDYKNSYINEWLNNQNQINTGIFEQKLNNPSEYLIPNSTCVDKINNVKVITCRELFTESLISIPSLSDYANTGSSKSFMNSEETFYLSNTNDKGKYWYVDEFGRVDTTDENIIIGIKPVITLKKTVKLLNGNGTKEQPYEFDNTKSLFASYVKLGNDLWQVYDTQGENLKLSLTSYLKVNNNEIKYKYSNMAYQYDSSKLGTLAHYLNNNYLNSLSYKNLIIESEYLNGVYENYDYKLVLDKKINTKVSILSIGNVFLNNKSNNYFISTGVSDINNKMYVMNNNFKVSTQSTTSLLSIIPAITINKNSLTKGNGTIESPYEV